MSAVPLKYRVHVIAGQAPAGSMVHPKDEGAVGIEFVQGNAEFGPLFPVPKLVAEHPPKVAPKGSVLLSVRAPVGALNLVRYPLGIGRGVAALVPRSNCDLGFLWWAMHDARRQLAARAVGTTYAAVNPHDIKTLPLPDMPVHEQKRAAAFLDRESARIEDLRARFTAMAEKADAWFKAVLYEKLIAHPPYASLGRICTLQRGFDLPDEQRKPGEVPVIGSGGQVGVHNATPLSGPGVVTGRYGSVGLVHWLDGPYWPLNTTLYVRDFKRNAPRWIYYLLKALPLKTESAKSAVPGLHRADAHRLRATLIPGEQQHSVVAELDEVAAYVANVSARASRAQSMLHEYRDALIKEVIAGDLDFTSIADSEMDERAHAGVEAGAP